MPTSFKNEVSGGHGAQRQRIIPVAMTGIVLLIIMASHGSAQPTDDRVRAFPEAEGPGAFSRGGRGGKVLFVTNLNDSGAGSLRAAVETSGPRTVLFRVAGNIELQRPLRVRHPYLTIAGQSAPGEGVCLKNDGLVIGATHDVIVRYLRCRPGDRTSDPGDMDAITIFDAHNVIVDHCSATWSTDECLSVTRGSDNVTVQWCLIAEGLTSHSMGSIIGAYGGKIAYHHNLYANNRSRNPRITGHHFEPGREQDPGPVVDFRNNVIFNWASSGGYAGGSDPKSKERTRLNYVDNYLKPGPDTRPGAERQAFRVNVGATTQIHFSGNVAEDAEGRLTGGRSLLFDDGGDLTLRPEPFPGQWPEREKLQTAYQRVLEDVGATRPARDAVDRRIVNGVRQGTGRILDSQDDVGGWKPLDTEQPEPDEDRDGLPDAWERQHNLDPTAANDRNDDPDQDGSLNLEEFLNGTNPRTSSEALNPPKLNSQEFRPSRVNLQG